MPPGEHYQPPAVAVMEQTQNTADGLRLLLAQRRMYRIAKRWQAARWLGVLVLAVAAPFVALLLPTTAVAVGAVAGVWLFAGRTLLSWAEARQMTRAACVQEDFDLLTYGMPRIIGRSAAPPPEDVARIVGDETGMQAAVEQERLADWYSFGGEHSGVRAVAIAQRANASYTAGLIRTVVCLWTILVAVWLAVLITWALLAKLPLGTFLLGVALPVLPSVLDVVEYLVSTWRAGHDRADLARSIEGRLRALTTPLEPYDLLVWQERLFDLRRTTPQVPDWLYRLNRRNNEAAMRAAARRLASH